MIEEALPQEGAPGARPAPAKEAGTMRARLACLLAALAALAILAAGSAGAQAPATAQPATHDVDILWGVKVPLRDGVKLNATIYKPAGQKDALPAVFTLTPYISDTYHDRAMYFARNGYVYTLADVRGRGNSEGQFEPFVNEGRDGADVVEWLARQPWCNGKVAMWGGSYAGFDQWSTLKELPPHLATIVPAAAAHAGVDFPFFYNIFYSYDVQWLTFTSGVTPNNNFFEDSSYWIEKFREMYLQHLAFDQLDRVVGNPSPIFQKWLEHPTPDAYWDAMAPTPSQYKQIKIPILTITADYDDDQPGALTYYREHLRYGTPESIAQHYLIIGPWDHAGTRTPRADVGGLHFGPASLLDLNKLHKDWYDWAMKGGPKPEFLKKRVAYYVPGLEQWKYADSLDGISKNPLTMYLHSEGRATDVFRSGLINEDAPGAEPADHYTYDPMDTRPAELETQEVKNYLTDQRAALNLFGNGLVFHSAPFVQPAEISGTVQLIAWMAMDVPDTDFQATLYEILPDGTSIQLTSDQMRARYRDSLTQETPVRAGEISRYEFRTFTWFSRRIARGSRLRLVLSCPNSIYLENNYNSGGVVARESGKDARSAHITLYHDAQHPSALALPLVR
jgi:putative CocE/NonD family hydrolase